MSSIRKLCFCWLFWCLWENQPPNRQRFSFFFPVFVLKCKLNFQMQFPVYMKTMKNFHRTEEANAFKWKSFSLVIHDLSVYWIYKSRQSHKQSGRNIKLLIITLYITNRNCVGSFSQSIIYKERFGIQTMREEWSPSNITALNQYTPKIIFSTLYEHNWTTKYCACWLHIFDKALLKRIYFYSKETSHNFTKFYRFFPSEK